MAVQVVLYKQIPQSIWSALTGRQQTLNSTLELQEVCFN